MHVRFFVALTLLIWVPALARAELVAYWPFEDFPDELTTPDMANNYDLELLSGGVFDAANHVDGKIGKAFEFFGATDSSLFFYTQQDASDKLPINLQPEWSISMWARVEGTGQSDLRLFSESNTQGNNDPLFNIGTANNGADGSLDIYIRNAAATSTPTVNHPHTTAHPFNGEWNHIGWTYADGMHNVWINGFKDSSYPMQSFSEIDPPNIDTTTVGGILRAAASHWVTGTIDEVAIWDQVLPGGTIYGLAMEQTTPPEALSYVGVLPPLPVAGAGQVGSDLVLGARENQVYGPVEGDVVPGLGQSWFAVGNPGNKAGVDAIVDNNDPIVPYFQGAEMTWWSGSDIVTDVQKYPADFSGLLGGTSDNHDNYTVKLEGEIFIEESRTIRFLDGVDDYTYLAIDTDRSGVAGDIAGEIIINDNNWTNALSNANGNGGAPIMEVDFQDIATGGEWLAIAANVAEGTGGDSGMLYWDVHEDAALFFPQNQGDGVADIDAAIFMIPDTHLRSPETPAPLLSADIVASVAAREGGWELDVNSADGTSDAFAVENPDENIFTTFLDVDGVELHINALGEVSEGDSFQIVLADGVLGTPIIATEGWSFNPATGFITFGSLNPIDCNGDGVVDLLDANCAMIDTLDDTLAAAGLIKGDVDGDGEVQFSDFVILAGKFAGPGQYTDGDLDLSGDVQFPDFVILAGNFGLSSAGEAAAVPEPTSLVLLGMTALAGGLLRRRRG